MKIRHRFKHAFIPHEHNEYKPHFFREASVSMMLVVSLGLFAISGSSALVIQKTEMGTRIAVNVLIDLTNERRLENNLGALIHNPLLDTAAQLKAEDMIRGSYFAHYSPDGVTPWYWFSKVGYLFVYAGENLAVNFSESQDIEDAWMGSPLHRANILDSRFKEIGLATSLGMYEGNNTTFVVQLFGTPITTLPKKVVTSITVSSTTASSSTEELLSTGAQMAVVKGETFNASDTSNERMVLPLNDSQAYSVVSGSTSTSIEDIASITPVAGVVPVYSTWYERLLYTSPTTVTALYVLLSVFIGIALFLMIVIEIKRQHPKNIIYGALMLTILLLLIHLNQTHFVNLMPVI